MNRTLWPPPDRYDELRTELWTTRPMWTTQPVGGVSATRLSVSGEMLEGFGEGLPGSQVRRVRVVTVQDRPEWRDVL